jgi:hypothetical protein
MDPNPGHGRCELDSHADTCVAGSNFCVLEMTDMKVDVHGYSKELTAIRNIPIATVGTVWTNPFSLFSIRHFTLVTA